jgi:hypothetical protein
VKLDVAIEDVLHDELELTTQLRGLAERHRADHDVYHLGHRLAGRCADRARRLLPFVERYGAGMIDVNDSASPGVLDALRQGTANDLGRTEDGGMLLHRDLIDGYLSAQRVEIRWIVLQQAAKAARDGELLDVVSSCHQEAETTAAWLRTRIKEGVAQILVTS